MGRGEPDFVFLVVCVCVCVFSLMLRIEWLLSYCCSVAKLCLTLGNPMDCSTPGFPVFHHLPELSQTHVHWVGDAIQLSHPLLSFHRLMSIESKMPSSHLILCCPLHLLPSIFSSIRERVGSASGGQSIRASASMSVLPMNIQGWFPLGLTGLISLLSKGLLIVFSTTIQRHEFFGTQLYLWSSSHNCIWRLKKP